MPYTCRRLFCLSLAVAVTALACGDRPRKESPLIIEDDAGAVDVGLADVVEEVDWNNPSAEGLSMAVVRAARTEVLDGAGAESLVAPDGSIFVTIDLKLRNDSATSVPLAATAFSVRTTAGLEFPGAVETAHHRDGCPQNASVSAGAQTGCVVVFVMTADDAPDLVTYTPPSGEAVSRPVTVEDCERCGEHCVDLQTSRDHCGACGQPAAQGTCVAGEIRCDAGLTLCDGACVDLNTDPKNCGACGWDVGSGGRCEDGAAVCDRRTIACDNKCVDPERLETCGSCERNCRHTSLGASLSCIVYSDKAQCEASVQSRTADCEQVCGSLSCVEKQAFYRNDNGGGVIDILDCSEEPDETAPSGGSDLPFDRLVCICE